MAFQLFVGENHGGTDKTIIHRYFRMSMIEPPPKILCPPLALQIFTAIYDLFLDNVRPAFPRAVCDFSAVRGTSAT